MQQSGAAGDPVVRQLEVITKVLLLAHGEQVERELGKLATTDDRKRMWILIDAKNMSKDIGQKLGVTERGVNYFLKQVEDAGFIENPRGKPPRRLVDYVPPGWFELLQREENPDEKAGAEKVEEPAVTPRLDEFAGGTKNGA